MPSKRRKVDAVCQVLQEKWTTSLSALLLSFFFHFNHHYLIHHAKNYNNFPGQLRAEKMRELLDGLKKPFTFSRS